LGYDWVIRLVKSTQYTGWENIDTLSIYKMEIIARLITTLYSEATISCIVNLKFKSYQTKGTKNKRERIHYVKVN